MLGEQERQCEEHERVDELGQPAVGGRHERRHHHFERGGRRTRNRKAGADGEHDRQAEEQGEFGGDPAGEFVEATGEGDRQHAENRQADRGDDEADGRRYGRGTGLSSDKRREDQVARSEEHRKEGKGHHQPLACDKFVHYGSAFLSCARTTVATNVRSPDRLGSELL